MTLKPDAKDCIIKEQILEDVDLVIQFEKKPDGESVLRLFGSCLTCGNREIIFSADGENVGAGTYMQGTHKPTWLTLIEDKED